MGQSESYLHNADEWAPTFKILGDPTRLRLLSALHFVGPYTATVTELAGITGVRVPTASAALRAMENMGTVDSSRSGRSIRYRIVDKHVHELLHWMGSGHREPDPARED